MDTSQVSCIDGSEDYLPPHQQQNHHHQQQGSHHRGRGSAVSAAASITNAVKKTTKGRRGAKHKRGNEYENIFENDTPTTALSSTPSSKFWAHMDEFYFRKIKDSDIDFLSKQDLKQGKFFTIPQLPPPKIPHINDFDESLLPSGPDTPPPPLPQPQTITATSYPMQMVPPPPPLSSSTSSPLQQQQQQQFQSPPQQQFQFQSPPLQQQQQQLGETVVSAVTAGGGGGVIVGGQLQSQQPQPPPLSSTVAPVPPPPPTQFMSASLSSLSINEQEEIQKEYSTVGPFTQRLLAAFLETPRTQREDAIRLTTTYGDNPDTPEYRFFLEQSVKNQIEASFEKAVKSCTVFPSTSSSLSSSSDTLFGSDVNESPEDDEVCEELRLTFRMLKRHQRLIKFQKNNILAKMVAEKECQDKREKDKRDTFAMIRLFREREQHRKGKEKHGRHK